MVQRFRTTVPVIKSTFEIDHQTPVVMIGSCFSDHMGKQLSRLKFPVLQNPFGVLYNPASIAGAIENAIENRPTDPSSIIFHDQQWHSLDFHGSFSHPSRDELISNCQHAINKTHHFLKSTKMLFVTFGTAWVFKHIETDRIVANCHKIPAKAFERYRLQVTEISRSWVGLIKQLTAFNPALKIIFTVSPVRHLKDGAHQNQLSKACLLLAIEEVLKQLPATTSYFPAYEIVNDELRDYRFYASDMTHMNEITVDYLFEKFASVYFNNNTLQLNQQLEPIIKAAQHRVLNNNPEKIKKFAASMIKKLEKLEMNYPFVKLQSEKEYFKNL
ncbi:GSCFA domain-containing protein [Roseimarinus sediminis]|uniref:GSCFA domain-containing protein n=1 Tax=Roseimarinus sediminis TaxID=1610899 RepID=UPI003D202391